MRAVAVDDMIVCVAIGIDSTTSFAALYTLLLRTNLVIVALLMNDTLRATVWRLSIIAGKAGALFVSIDVFALGIWAAGRWNT